jgi:hypothetical protein
MRSISFCALIGAGLALAGGAAHADGGKLAFTGNGKGERHCFTYEMHVEMTLQGDKVVGTFQQKTRPKYQFSLPIDASGNFNSPVPIANGNKLVLSGTATPTGGNIKMTGYCNFAGKLTPQ